MSVVPPSSVDYASYVRRELPSGPRRARKNLTPSATQSVHAEYLSLTSVVRSGVDVAKRARADGFRARIEDLMVSGQAAEDGSLRVLRAALSKADKQRAQLRQEEKRVSRARAKMRIIEDSYLVNNAPDEARELQKSRAGLSHLRLQAYCALRSQLQVERAVGSLARVLADLAALLKALTEEYDQVRTHTIGPPNDEGSVGSVPSGAMEEQQEDEAFSIVSYDVLDSTNYEAPSVTEVPASEVAEVAEVPSTSRLRYNDRTRKPSNLNFFRDRRQPSINHYDGGPNSAAQGSSSRLFRSRLWGRSATPSERADSELASVQNSEVNSEGLLRSEPSVRRERKFPIFSQVRSSVKATRALSRFTMARVRLPSTAKKMWNEIDERYSSILGLAPHLIERRLVPLESIEEGLLGPWQQRDRNVSGTARVEKMVATVDNAIVAVDSILSWQNSLVSTIRVDYRKHRDALRAAETKISNIYVQQISGVEWTTEE